MIRGSRLLSPGPQIKCGRSEIVARLPPLASRTICSALRLGAGIGGLEIRRIRNRLVDALHVSAVEHHAGRAGVDDPRSTPACRQAAITLRVPWTLVLLILMLPGPRCPPWPRYGRPSCSPRPRAATTRGSATSPWTCSTPSSCKMGIGSPCQAADRQATLRAAS